MKSKEKAKSTILKEKRYKILLKLNLIDEFKKSAYSSYGWFLRSLGIRTSYERIECLRTSKFYNVPDMVEIEASWGAI